MMNQRTLDLKVAAKRRLIAVAEHRQKADLVIKNASYVNVFTDEICQGDIAVQDGFIAGIGEYSGSKEIDAKGHIVTPGLIDSHIHLESALVLPSRFAEAVIPHGTTAVVTDPHEIVNVLGANGLRFMLQATSGLPLDVYFMVPSCVPATPYDESYKALDAKAIEPLLAEKRVLGLAEVMNFVGVANGDRIPLEKIVMSEELGKIADGHAPGLGGPALQAYIGTGIYSDHECDALDNAIEKLSMGQWIMVREGTAAQNINALLPLFAPRYAARILLATDDKHPNDLLNGGHIDFILRKAIAAGADPILAIKAATYNPAIYFGLKKTGAVAPGYRADLVIFDSLPSLKALTVVKNGEVVFEKGKIKSFRAPQIGKALLARAQDTIRLDEVEASAFASQKPLGLIGMVPHQILTKSLGRKSKAEPEKDILRIAALERHRKTGHIGLGFIKGYGLRKGAVATSISHDSHNIIVVGANDSDMALAVNELRNSKGGIVIAEGGRIVDELPLPIAGLMSVRPLAEVNARLEELKKTAHALGVPSDVDPFMTLSFMSLSVIPEIRILTRGVFDVLKQEFLK